MSNNNNNNKFPFDDEKKRATNINPTWQQQQTTAMRSSPMMPNPNDIIQQQSHSSSSLGGPTFRHVAMQSPLGSHFAPPPLQMPSQVPGFPGPAGVNHAGYPPAGGMLGMPPPSMMLQPPHGQLPTMPTRLEKMPRNLSTPTPPYAAPPAPPAPPAFGWDLGKLKFQEIDPYFPMDMIKLRIPSNEVDDALRRMADCFKTMSIQVDFEHDPAGAKLRTMEHIELYMVFFEETDGTLCVDIQRRQGDYLDANRYVHSILNAARGETVKPPCVAPPKASQIRAFEAFLNRCTTVPATAPQDAAVWPGPPTPDESMKSTLANIHDSLTSRRMDQRKSGLDNLNIFTDMGKALSTTTIASSLVVVTGTPPADEYKQQCMDIRRVLLTIIVKQQFEGDDTNMLADMDEDVVGFLSVDSGKQEGRSKYYDDYISELFHLALTILSNSLETLETFKSDEKYDMKAAVSDLNSDCLSYFEIGIVETLMKVVGRAQLKLPDAYLACKALRLLLGANAELCSVFRSNPKHKESVGTAIAAGAHHIMLLSEAEKLRSCFTL